MNLAYLKIEAGDNIGNIIHRYQEAALQLKTSVSFVFNGITVIVNDDSDIEQLLQDYHNVGKTGNKVIGVEKEKNHVHFYPTPNAMENNFAISISKIIEIDLDDGLGMETIINVFKECYSTKEKTIILVYESGKIKDIYTAESLFCLWTNTYVQDSNEQLVQRLYKEGLLKENNLGQAMKSILPF